jgi:ribose transport system permease protein
MHLKNSLRMLLTGQNSRQGMWLLPLLMTVLVMVWIALRQPTFLGSQNLQNLIAQAVPLILASMGQLIVVLIGGLDLSVGAVMSLTTVILACGAPAYILIPGIFTAAALIGWINGAVIARLNVHPIIATLSTASAVQGVALWVRPVAGGEIPSVVLDLVSGQPLGVPMALIWVVVAVALGCKLIHLSRFGLHLFAVGGGSEVARSYGIQVERTIINAYMLSAIFAAAAGMFVAGRVVSGDPNIGALFAIESITAVALGGVQLAGGIGGIAGALTGSVFLALLANCMNLENLSAFIQTVIKGLILLAVVAMQPRKNIGL